ncbi:Rpn family recombination-promoting nuclease/putative transposase [Mycetohabitans endofungorum]|uniref:Rpn family recombination-promoting nuclease/putative transposase n=1 Tax=Mycetohabitans endofungorum TaxID=417203 RepID=UPI003BB02942
MLGHELQELTAAKFLAQATMLTFCMKRSSTMTPHDTVFRQFLTHPKILTLHLPTQWLVQCDLDTLRLKSGSLALASQLITRRTSRSTGACVRNA